MQSSHNVLEYVFEYLSMYLSRSTVWCKQNSGLTVTKKLYAKNYTKYRFEPQRYHKFVRALKSKNMKYSPSEDLQIGVLNLKIKW